MTTILHVSSSVRSTGSISRQLSNEFVAKLKAAAAGNSVVLRDLTADPVPHLTEQMMGAYFTPAEQRSAEQIETVKLSDNLVAELMAADVVVIAAPMYNFSVSSTLKAWIDHIARAGLTFKYGANGPEGLVSGKKFYVFTSRGGVYSEGPAKVMDFHETYLRAVFGFLGVTDITFIHSEGLAMGDEAVNAALAGSRSAIDGLIAA
ncbi:MAG: FMN-dependent NADH-azoreductase [Burkholderiaceae bacterium]